jgi:hypothetical protein
MALTTWMLSAPHCSGQTRDILVNGGFEQGMSGWTPAPGHEIVTQPGTAFAGAACLSGEVTQPNQHLSIRQTVTLKAGNRYELQLAARATNKTKLVLFQTREGQRTNIAAWQDLPRQWRRYRTPLTVPADGLLELELVAPSSHAAPAGRVWIDDVQLLETKMPALLPVNPDGGFHDEPAMVRAADQSLWVAWISYLNGADTLQVARFRTQDGQLVRQGTWQIAGGKDSYLLGPAVAAAGNAAVVVYAAEVQGNWDVFAVECGPEGPENPRNVSRDPAVDVNPAAAWRDGALWVVWESNRNGRRQILATANDGAQSPAIQEVSPRESSAYDPEIALLANGELCVAWHSFRDNNYDIYLRRRNPMGTWGAETRLTRAPGVDRHAVLLARDNELFLAYEHAQVEKYYVGRTNDRRVVIAQVQPDGLFGMRSSAESPLSARSEAPTLAWDESGRLWVAYLQPRQPRSGWDAFLTCFDGQSWRAPQALSLDKGMDRRPALVPCDRGWAVAFQSDNMPVSWNDVDLTATATSQVMLGLLETGPLPPAQAIAWEPLVEPAAPFEAAELRGSRGEDHPTPRIDYRGQSLQLFYGDLHQHSDVSVCNRLGDQSIEEDYQFSRDISRLDFACSTDHCYNFNAYLWSYTGKLARTNEDPGRYLTFLAEEWTSSFEETSAQHPYGFYGHRNLILGDPYFPRWWNSRNRQTPAQVWEELRKLNADFIHIPHQLADTGNVPTDWTFHDEQAQPVAEIFQVRGSYEYKGAPREAGRSTPPGYFLQDAWARGIVIGVIASPDHGGGYGKACVFSPDLSRSSILASLRARRCFGTTGARIFLDVRVNDHLMGEFVRQRPAGPVTVRITARCPAEIDRIEVCRNNQFIYTHQPEGRTATVTFVDSAPLSERSYYYVRLLQKDQEIAWSSPVWFGEAN